MSISSPGKPGHCWLGEHRDCSLAQFLFAAISTSILTASILSLISWEGAVSLLHFKFCSESTNYIRALNLDSIPGKKTQSPIYLVLIMLLLELNDKEMLTKPQAPKDYGQWWGGRVLGKTSRHLTAGPSPDSNHSLLHTWMYLSSPPGCKLPWEVTYLCCSKGPFPMP